MSQIKAPSASLLRALWRPSSSPCLACQTRQTSSWIPRQKYAKVNRLDKLHRQQKAQVKEEKEASITRATALQQQIQAAQEPLNPAELPFHIGRTKSKNIAVYDDTKAGGSKHVTILRKLTGDLQELQKQLRTALQLPEQSMNAKGKKRDPIEINSLTQQIVIKGWRKAEVEAWAKAVGF